MADNLFYTKENALSVVSAKVYDKEIVISSDSIVVFGSSKRTDGNFNKLESVNGMIIGSVGTAQEGSLMFHYANTHKPATATEKDVLAFMVEFARWKKEFNGDSYISNTFIIAYQGKLFEIENLLVMEIHNYTSIGAGMDFANAALYLGHTPEEAVKVACDLSCYVASPIITLKQNR